MSIFLIRGDFRQFIKNNPITFILALLNTIVFLITIFSGGFSIINLLRLGAICAPFIQQGEYYRLLFAMFLHGSIFHYLMNTYFGIIILGSALERTIGSFKYFIVYMLSGLVSSYFAFLTSLNSFRITLGASGAIYGVLGVFLYIILLKKTLIPYHDRKSILSLIIINALFTIFVPNISLVGHLSGFLTGLIISPFLILKGPRKQKFDNNHYIN